MLACCYVILCYNIILLTLNLKFSLFKIDLRKRQKNELSDSQRASNKFLFNIETVN